MVRGATVTIVEQASDYFPIQRHAGKRYLHPHIYDWPLNDVLLAGQGADKAELPLLAWQADEAQTVFQKLDEGWRSCCDALSRKGRKPTEHMPAVPVKLVAHPDTGRLVLTINKRIGSGSAKHTSEKISLQADIVILALGFGREPKEEGYPEFEGYWDDLALDSMVIGDKRRQYLVSGDGDGALTDLMRLCLKHFKHHEFVRRFAQDTQLIQTLKRSLVEPDHNAKTVRELFTELYPKLDGEAKINEKDIREDTAVTFITPQGKNYLESTGSSILNRFIVYQLETWFTLKQARTISPPQEIPGGGGRFQVKIKDEKDCISELEADKVVIRHGPKAALRAQTLPNMWTDLEDLYGRWKNLRQSEDRTRIQMWDPADYAIDRAPNSIDGPNLFDEGPHLHCLVLESTYQRSPLSLEQVVSQALNANRRRINGNLGLAGDASMDIRAVNVNRAVSSQGDYTNTVRALCRADVAVIDVTSYQPGMMLFLGIRAVAQRGVTIVTTNDELNEGEWSKQPFNLKELYPLSVKASADPAHDASRRLGEMLIRAIDQHASLRDYQDLPAYDAVRNLGPDPTYNLPVEPDEGIDRSILWLCSFDKNYMEEGFFERVRGVIGEEFEGNTQLQRITEIVSPQLVGQRLYSMIRRSSLCIVDWTLWSPNVFFEFGVRLAVNSKGPVCLLGEREKDRTDDEKLRAQRLALEKLFAPIRYDRDTATQKFKIRDRYQKMREVEQRPNPLAILPAWGGFPYNHTYRLVGDALPLHKESGAVSAHQLLERLADNLIGVGVTSNPEAHPVLFAKDNPQLSRQVRDTATELLIAAWLYLTYRRGKELEQDEEIHTQYRKFGRRITELLESHERLSKHDQRLLKLIDKAMR